MSVEWSEIPEKHPEESLYNAAPIFYDQTEAKKTIENEPKIIAEKLLSISQSSQKGKTMRKQYLQMGPCITVNH